MDTENFPLHRIQIRDSFWTPLRNLVIDTMIPYQEKVLNDEMPDVEKSHAIENFRIAAGLKEGHFYGAVFQDSDVAKWLESVAYSLCLRPDSALEARADEIIDIIAKAQQPDGYLNTYFTIEYPERKWQNLEHCHELYCAGHMMEAAAAYYKATGKDKLLHVMERMADLIIQKFGTEPGKEPGIPGHPEVELGLLRLYAATGKEKYKEQALYFVEQRGKNPDYFTKENARRGWAHRREYDPNYRSDAVYMQAHAPVYEQTEAIGHAVRAAYLYSAMAELARLEKNPRLYHACKTLWNDITRRKMSVTGGIGATADGEAFSFAYDLPNDTCYNETCASVAMVFFAKRMLDMEPKGEYADIMERELYNGTISGMALNGTHFFYVNPLESVPGISGTRTGYQHVKPQRPGWYACACCPPNLARMITSLAQYGWTETDDTLYCHLLMSQRAQFEKLTVEVESSYPWQGEITWTLHGTATAPYTLAVHLSGYVSAADVHLQLNGAPCSYELKDGYLYITRQWGTHDILRMQFPIAVRRVYANPKVRADVGCTALMRGPIVYCMEEVDNAAFLQCLTLPRDAEIETFVQPDGPLSGMVLLKAAMQRQSLPNDSLYAEQPSVGVPVQGTFVPYYAWGNRGEGEMRVWIPETYPKA